eukprot:6752043-Prymnesium_polylepis.1
MPHEGGAPVLFERAAALQDGRVCVGRELREKQTQHRVMAVHGREVHRRHALPRVRHVGARPDEHVRDVRVAVLRRHEQRCAAGVVGGEVDLLLAAVGEERLDHVDAPLLSCDGDGERGRARLEQRVAFELEQLLHHLEVARLPYEGGCHVREGGVPY